MANVKNSISFQFLRGLTYIRKLSLLHWINPAHKSPLSRHFLLTVPYFDTWPYTFTYHIHVTTTVYPLAFHLLSPTRLNANERLWKEKVYKTQTRKCLWWEYVVQDDNRKKNMLKISNCANIVQLSEKRRARERERERENTRKAWWYGANVYYYILYSWNLNLRIL